MDVSVKFFAAFFGVIALAIIFVKSSTTADIIKALGGSLSGIGSSLISGSAPIQRAGPAVISGTRTGGGL